MMKSLRKNVQDMCRTKEMVSEVEYITKACLIVLIDDVVANGSQVESDLDNNYDLSTELGKVCSIGMDGELTFEFLY